MNRFHRPEPWCIIGHLSEAGNMARGTGQVGVIGVLVLVVLGAIGGWYIATRWGTSSTKEARERCSQQGNREATIRGTIGDSLEIPLTEYGIYKILDDEGHLWVLSRQGVPLKGSKVKVKGRLLAMGDLVGQCGQEGTGADVCRAISGALRAVSGACVMQEEERR